ncbi:MAG: hypothetical protein H6567_07940 [Lewinellaceae bacterium]|nr:hypothetical protein [Lewinellaceae bacterium]
MYSKGTILYIQKTFKHPKYEFQQVVEHQIVEVIEQIVVNPDDWPNERMTSLRCKIVNDLELFLSTGENSREERFFDFHNLPIIKSEIKR